MRITSKGQVTIPQAIRRKLGLHPNTEGSLRKRRQCRSNQEGPRVGGAG
jgi:AbrB family looped-hinge helix DNA binding protein